MIFIGSLNMLIVYLREVFKEVFCRVVVFIICFYNYWIVFMLDIDFILCYYGVV